MMDHLNLGYSVAGGFVGDANDPIGMHVDVAVSAVQV